MQQLKAVRQNVFLYALHFPITQLEPTIQVNECLIKSNTTMAVICAVLLPNKVFFTYTSCNILPVF